MANAALLYENLADDGTVSASSALSSAPATRLQNVHVRRRWKGRLGDSEWVLLDLGASTLVDTICLFGLAGIFDGTERNLSELAIRRVRLSLTDPTGEAGEVYDSDDNDSGVGFIKEAYAAMVELLDTPVSARYVLVDLSEVTAEAIMAGRLVVGLRDQFIYNFFANWSFGYVDLSRRKKSAGGQTFVERDERYRVLTLDFGAIDEDDRYGFIHEMDRINGMSRDILFIIDPESDDITRDTIWGLPPELSRVTQPYMDDIFAKSLSIEERM